MELPQPEFVGLMAGDDSSGARSPKYPSTVTKVLYMKIFNPRFNSPAFIFLCLLGIC